MKKTNAYGRWQRNRAIKRKIGILQRIGGADYVDAWTRGARGRLDKGKLHCSCPLCRRKSYDERSHSDQKALLSARQQLADWFKA